MSESKIEVANRAGTSAVTVAKPPGCATIRSGDRYSLARSRRSAAISGRVGERQK